MPELANPRKRGRPPKNTAVLGETVKRQRIDRDITSPPPPTPKALEVLRSATVLSRASASRSTATTQGDRGHFARSSQGNHRIAADPEDDLESLHSSLPRKVNGRSSHGRQSRMSRQPDDELDDTIIVTPERRRGRPQGPKTTEEGRSSRNEHSENGSRAVDLPNSRGGSTGSSPRRGRMQPTDASEVPETPTKRGRGRPRKFQITPGDVAHTHGHSENWGSSNAQRADTMQPQSLRSSVLSDPEKHSTSVLLGETKTKRKRGRPRKGPAKQSERSLSLAVDDEIAEPPVEDPARIQQVEVLKTIVLEKLTGKRDVRLVGLDDERGKVRQLLEQTVVSGEGNSMLLIGARGSGKSTLVERIISEISSEHKEDFHTVRLNGFIHTDDKLALREIWRQLGIEMEVEDDLMGKTSNYADILSSLLALLSHPSELSENSLNHTAKSVIFILSEFDLFTSHPRQTLLYNLFDIAQGRKAPILVLGLTTRIDVVESLEKRVKSRFSHRHVHLSLPKSLGAFWEICKQALLVSVDDIQTAEQKEALMLERDSCVLEAWNSVIEVCDKHQDPKNHALGDDTDFKHLLQSIFYTTKGVKDFHVACLLPIINLSPQTPNLKGRNFIENSLVPPESKLHILDGLSDLELSLLIAAARLDIILDTDTCNFNMAYDEYTTLASRVKLQSSASGAAAVGAGSKIWGREVGLGAWERLAEYSLIIPAIGGTAGAISGNGTRDVGRMGRMFRVDVGLEEIWQSMPNLGAVMAKWCREI
ncbi:MAG: hypothetical protein M1840_002929 [Geoglossum simile]|nr:MAG: hypothetical protein M1840_002929 [Geoglossum simile]